MKKNYTRQWKFLTISNLAIVTSLFFTSTGHAQTGNVHIPDPNFKNALLDMHLSLPSSTPPADSNNDGEISYAEAAAITALYIPGKSIGDLTGIEAFINITSLNCSNNNISRLDLSQNPHLNEIFCGKNTIEYINFSNSTGLTKLSCEQNQITTLDVTHHPLLSILNCSYNKITGLDISNNPLLQTLYCNNNKLEYITFHNNEKLEVFDARINKIKKLDMSSAKKLVSFNLTQNEGLTYVNVANGNNEKIMSADFRQNPELRCIHVDDSKGAYLTKKYYDSFVWEIDPTVTYISGTETSCPSFLSVIFKTPLQATVKNNAVQLTWATGAEQKDAQFIIERSLNGTQFTAIATLAGKGNNSSYLYNDYTAQGIVYYRIAEINTTGIVAYSYIISATANKQVVISLYPNPVSNGVLNIANAGFSNIEIVSNQGQKVFTTKGTGAITRINTTRLEKGYYFAIIDGKSYQFFIE